MTLEQGWGGPSGLGRIIRAGGAEPALVTLVTLDLGGSEGASWAQWSVQAERGCCGVAVASGGWGCTEEIVFLGE